jgi:gamma-tubulin complex component 2
MVHFMDISEEEMSKNVKEIKENRLESLLELSLRITSANSDPYKDDLKVKLFKNDLKSMITRIQMIDAQSSGECLLSINFIKKEIDVFSYKY